MTIVAPLLDAAPTFFGLSLGIPTFASGPESDPTYSIKSVDMLGNLITDLTLAEPDTITETLNQPTAATFHFPKGAYTATDVAVLKGALEVQIYRNGDLKAWGPVVGLEAAGSKGQVDCSLVGPEWYFNRRFIDAPIVNLGTNPDFESGTSGWSSFGGVGFSIDTANFATGTQSADLTSSADDGYIGQITAPIAPNAVGTLITASAWFFTDSFTAPANQKAQGLYIETVVGGVVTDNNYYVIDNATLRGVWTKASTTVWIPPGVTASINTKLFCPHGEIHWDDFKLVFMGSIGSNGAAVDMSDLVRKMVILVGDAGAGKSDVHVGLSTATVGVKMPKQWQFVDHVQFDQALLEFVQRDDGIDYSMDLTPTSRTFHQYAGKRGTDLSGSVTLAYDSSDPSGRNCIDYRYRADGGTCVSRQIVLGSDNGPAREQGEAVDASHIGGTILQDVHQASQDAEPASLQPIAQERLARYSTVPEVIEMDVIGASGLIPTLHCGDLVHVDIFDGYVGIVGETRRIMQMVLNCVTNILTVTVARDTL